MPTSHEKSPFSKYSQGYIDGFEGEEIKMPDDTDYMDGYHAGHDDDAMGMPQKYSSHNMTNTSIIKPTECSKL